MPREGCCLKCNKPIFIRVSGKNNGICPDCVAEFEKMIKAAAARKGQTTKTTFYHPPDYRDEES